MTTENEKAVKRKVIFLVFFSKMFQQTSKTKEPQARWTCLWFL